jgi:hypothetical protein
LGPLTTTYCSEHLHIKPVEWIKMHLAPAGCSQDLAKMIEGLKSGGNIEDHSEFCSAFLFLAIGLSYLSHQET